MNFLLKFLSSPKVIAAILGVAVSSGVIWYGIDLLQENGTLEAKLEQKEAEIASIESTLQEEREEFQKTISNYDEVMSSYLNQLADNQQSSQRLRQTISRLSAENNRLGQCFNEQVPQELIDQLWEGQQG